MILSSLFDLDSCLLAMSLKAESAFSHCCLNSKAEFNLDSQVMQSKNGNPSPATT